MKFEKNWLRGFRGEVVWNSQHFSHSNLWGSYKCIGKRTWPCRKKVKRQHTTILLATLVDLPSPMICAKIQPKASSVLEKMIFKCFYHIWAWRPSWSTDRDHFSNLLFPHPKEAPYEIWAKLAQRLQRRSRLKMLTDGRTDGRTHARSDDGRKVITIAHPEHSSGELTKGDGAKSKKGSFHSCTRHVVWSCSTFLPSTIEIFHRVFQLQSRREIYFKQNKDRLFQKKESQSCRSCTRHVVWSSSTFLPSIIKYSKGSLTYRADTISMDNHCQI